MARKILVADDSPAIQKRAAGLLAGEGIEVVTVANGIAAIKKLSTVNPHIVLADVSMPGKDGYEVCDYIKKSPEYGKTVVLLIVSDMEPYDEMRGRRVRSDGIVKKPFTGSALQDVIQTYLARIRIEPPPPPEQPAEASVASESLRVPEPEEEIEEIQVEEKLPEPDFSALKEPLAIGDFPTEQPPAAVEVEPAGEASSPSAVTEPSHEEKVDIGEVSLGFPDAGSEPKLVESAEESTEPGDAASSDLDKTVLFMNPIEVADPVLQDETIVMSSTETSEGKSPELAVSENPLEAPSPRGKDASISATSLEKFSLEDAVEGNIRLGPTGPEAGESQPVEKAAAAEPAPGPQKVDLETVRSVVERTVLRMMPEITEEVIERVTKALKSELEKK